MDFVESAVSRQSSPERIGTRMVAKYPELRDTFAAVVARAVAPNGQDYGSLLPMKEIK